MGKSRLSDFIFYFEKIYFYFFFMKKANIVNPDNIILYVRREMGRIVSLPLETLDRTTSHISNSYYDVLDHWVMVSLIKTIWRETMS